MNILKRRRMIEMKKSFSYKNGTYAANRVDSSRTWPYVNRLTIEEKDESHHETVGKRCREFTLVI